MGDMTKFNSAIEYYIFNVLLMCLLISEIFIFFYTRSKQNRTEKIDTRDLGTKWLLYLNFVFCLIISFLCISQKAPFCIRELTLPAYFAKIGMLIIAVGICIRIKAVLTLKKAFTKMPFTYSLFKMFAKSHMKKKYPIEGFTVKWRRYDYKEIHFDIVRCIYKEMCEKYCCPELCTVFCQSDVTAFAGYKPKIRFERLGTIGEGANCCDFHFIRGK